MSITSPLVSVVMPCYNTEKYLIHATNSILEQTFKNWELIMIDDCSSDTTWEIMNKLASSNSRIRIFKNSTNMKICKTLNYGIEQAKGKYIVRMDSDDWSFPNRLEKQVSFMENNPQVGVSGGMIQICDSDLNFKKNRSYNKADTEIRKKLFRYSPFAHPATIWRKDIMRQAGLYNPSLIVAQDYDLYFRMGALSEFANLDDTLLKLRIHTKSSSQTKSRLQEKNTLYIRLKAVFEYGYDMSLTDKLYLFLQLMSMFLIPQKLKLHIFNLIRA